MQAAGTRFVHDERAGRHVRDHPPEVSRHLSVLKKAELVTVRRRGRYVLHQLDVAAVARIGSDFLETVLR